ncbi:flagellar biosynthesis anti-sigma factor FlgM [Kurthia sp. 3B1D]|uniref:Negative regulator of flagellin synthesis n=1 Tax=Candidatus Kurthia intestinigallinarum TaxID=1562256 RepID=A0A433RTW4_9BACL|nr:flagellar biosynthesis anti-sigma factor FlgM [Kurthia sp. 3B1D]RUS55578.1 flagellar biosynthesis anti-sigma factor FlgM [Kurthia sp. 3B1D]
MKVQGYGVNAVNPYKNQQVKTNEVKKSSLSFQDQLEISSQAKDLQGVKSYESERADRLSELKSQIQNGTYKIDSEKLAKDLLNHFRR